MRIVMVARSERLSLADLQAALAKLEDRSHLITMVMPDFGQPTGLRALSLESAVHDNAALVKLRTIMVGAAATPIWLYRGGTPSDVSLDGFAADVRSATGDVVITADPANFTIFLELTSSKITAITPVLDETIRRRTKDFFLREFRKFSEAMPRAPMFDAVSQIRVQHHYLTDPRILFGEAKDMLLDLDAAALAAFGRTRTAGKETASLGLSVAAEAQHGLLVASPPVKLSAGNHILLVGLWAGGGAAKAGPPRSILLGVDCEREGGSGLLLSAQAEILPFGGSQQFKLPFSLPEDCESEQVTIRLWKYSGNAAFRITSLNLFRTAAES